jgi:hypothetical protein
MLRGMDVSIAMSIRFDQMGCDSVGRAMVGFRVGIISDFVVILLYWLCRFFATEMVHVLQVAAVF